MFHIGAAPLFLSLFNDAITIREKNHRKKTLFGIEKLVYINNCFENEITINFSSIIIIIYDIIFFIVTKECAV